MFATDMTFEKIVEKTKRMLGKNYRGDQEIVPVYSSFSPIEGHTDAFSTISNSGFTNDEVALVKEKTNNYAWWMAYHGYLLEPLSMTEIPALFIQGSEIGKSNPNVLNFNGLTEGGYYFPIDRTNITGEVDDTSNHIFVQFMQNNEKIDFETDINGNNGGKLTINEIEYDFYAGRLFTEDKVIVDGNLTYPIYLVSNLDYYYIPTEGEVGEALGGAHDTEPEVRNNLEILEDTCEMVIREAAEWTNRMVNTKLMNECWPVIVKCSCVAYLNRGAEGLNSQSELGQQNVYNDWVDILHKQLINRRYVL